MEKIRGESSKTSWGSQLRCIQPQSLTEIEVKDSRSRRVEPSQTFAADWMNSLIVYQSASSNLTVIRF